jgi:hypothetical protein
MSVGPASAGRPPLDDPQANASDDNSAIDVVQKEGIRRTVSRTIRAHKRVRRDGTVAGI